MTAPPGRIPKAALFGCVGLSLSFAERRFFEAENPLGFILFARNCRDPEQIRALVAELRALVGRPNAPVLIDQEGGRVQRLKPPQWRGAPPAKIFGDLARIEGAAGHRAAWINARLIAADLADLGITVDCAPVLDNPQPDAHEIIGDRAYAEDPALIASLARTVTEGLKAGGVLPVIKHIPGHGRANVDSHLHCPVVDASAAELEATDLPAFKALADQPFAMTAHVVYTAWDADTVATMSPMVIGRIIRDAIGFEGVLMSDDLSMRALGGPMADRARKSLAAGCDLVLHCNGIMAEMKQIAAVTPILSGRAQDRVEAALAQLRPPVSLDREALQTELTELLALLPAA